MFFFTASESNFAAQSPTLLQFDYNILI